MKIPFSVSAYGNRTENLQVGSHLPIFGLVTRSPGAPANNNILWLAVSTSTPLLAEKLRAKIVSRIPQAPDPLAKFRPEFALAIS
jgi:hypothetical protein